MTFNKTILVGNLTRDVEMRYTAKGGAIGSFTVACNRQWKSESGEKKEEVSFIPCAIFGKSAETLAEYAKKGSALLVEGRLKMEEWTDKQTSQKKTALRVVVENFQFLSKPQQSESAPSKPTSKPTQDDDSMPPF